MNKTSIALAASLALGGISMQASAIHLVNAVLPDVGASYDGLAVATQFDDFYGYSLDLLDQLQAEGHIPLEFGTYSFSTGTGGLDVLLYTGSGGVHSGNDNQAIGPGNAYFFEDPVHNPSGSATSFEGWWGQADQDNDGVPDPPHNVHGPVTVGQVHNYLHALDPDNDIPVFYADLNQTGSGASANMQVTVNAKIIDPGTITDLSNPLVYSDDVVVASWSFDGNTNDIYDPYTYVNIPKDQSLVGTSGHVYNINYNRGSGQPDFAFYAPTLDLSLFNDSFLFVLEGKINNLNDGFEEFFLTGALAPHFHDLPMPGLPALMAAGLVGIMVARRRTAGKAVA